MHARHTGVGRRVTAVAVTLGLFALMGATTADAKTKAKAKKTTKKKAAATTTTKRTTATTAVAAAKPKGTIKVGVIGVSVNATTGAKTLEETRKVAQVWETLQNRAGGVNGYKVDVIYKETNGDAARSLQAVKELDKQGVVAIVGEGDATGLLASLDVIRDKKLPVIGGSALDVSWDTHPMLFGVGASQYAAVYASVFGAKGAGAKNYESLYCTESQACANSIPTRSRAGQALGIKVRNEGASATAVDYTSNCLSARNADVDYIHSAAIPMASLVRDCARQGYHPMYGQTVTANYQATIDSLKGERFVGPQQEMPAWYDGPEAAPFRAAMKLTDLKETEYGQTSVQTWQAYETLKAVLNRMTATNPTRGEVVQALCTIKGETLGGMSAPLDYTGQCTGERHSLIDCWFNTIIDDGKFFLMNKAGGKAKNIADALRCGTDQAALPNK